MQRYVYLIILHYWLFELRHITYKSQYQWVINNGRQGAKFIWHKGK